MGTGQISVTVIFVTLELFHVCIFSVGNDKVIQKSLIYFYFLSYIIILYHFVGFIV